MLPGIAIRTTLVDTTDFGALELGVRKETGIVYIESPTNPTLKLVDIARAAKLAHANGAVLMDDNTYASPINQNPVDFGADVVLDRMSKYINGHAVLVAGATFADK